MSESRKYLCPLCKSPLSRDRWIMLVGEWKEKEKAMEKQQKELETIKKEKATIEKKAKIDAKKLANQAELIGIKKGVEKEKNQTKRMVKMIEKQTRGLQANQKKIKELEIQLKKGTTPQLEGFDYEKEVHKMLSENFPEDKITQTGKKGDNIQIVKSGDKEVGKILYECKKTSVFSNSFFTEVRRHQESVKADYAVLVTHASKKGKSSFFVERGVIVVDPLGLLDVASLLREALIEMHQLKLTKDKMGKKGEEILKYMQTNEFRSRMLDAIDKSEEAYKNMLNEIKNHKKDWLKRYKLYASIHSNVQTVRMQLGAIITGNKALLNQVKLLEKPKEVE